MSNIPRTFLTVHQLKLLKSAPPLFLLATFLSGIFLSSTAAAVPNCAAAIPATINTTTAVRSYVANTEQAYKVTTPSDGLLSVFPKSNSGKYLQLYDKDCHIASPLRYNSLSESVGKGVYYISVKGSVSETYKLEIDGDFINDDRSNTCTNAWVVRNAEESGELGPYGDNDYFQVTLNGRTPRLNVELFSNNPAYLKVYDKDCIAASPLRYRSLSETLTRGPGTYYVAVLETGDGSKGKYTLSFSGDIVKPVGTCNGKQATRSGTNGDDLLVGTPGIDVIQGFGGNDVIYGLAGDDTICGGDGEDVIQGGDGIDRLSGDAGNDVLQGGEKNDALSGGLGIDLCDGGNGVDVAATCEVKNLVP